MILGAIGGEPVAKRQLIAILTVNCREEGNKEHTIWQFSPKATGVTLHSNPSGY